MKMSQSPSQSLDDERHDANLRRPAVTPPTTDCFGLPLNIANARTITTSSGDDLGDLAMRSVGVTSTGLCPPSLMLQGSTFPSSHLLPSFKRSEEFCLEPPALKKSLSSYPRDFSSCSNKPKNEVSTSVSIWNVPEGSLKPVPEFYPLERSSRFVEGSSPSEIATRISSCLRRRSIAAVYDDEKAKAKCKTADGVDFRIRLYAGKGAYCHGVIVEVQLRSGWSVSFKQDCDAIIESAEGDGEGERDIQSVASMDLSLNEIAMKEVQKSKERREVSSVLDKLIFSDRLDSMIIGMKSLCTKTDPTRVGSEASHKNACDIIQCDTNNQVRNVLTGLLKCKPSLDDACEEASEAYTGKLRHLAFKVLANSVAAMPNEVHQEAMNKDSWILESLIELLIKELREAEARPHEATLAAKCLNVIVAASSEGARRAKELGACYAMKSSNEVGVMSHVNLAYEADRGCVMLMCC